MISRWLSFLDSLAGLLSGPEEEDGEVEETEEGQQDWISIAEARVATAWFSLCDRAGFTMYRRWRIRSRIGLTGDRLAWGWIHATWIMMVGQLIRWRMM